MEQPQKEMDIGILFLVAGVRTIHGVIVLFVLLGILSNAPMVLLLHATTCMSLLVHWYNNSNVCSLSMFEAYLRGINYTQSFTHSIIAPVYDISQTTWSNVCYIITICVMCISFYKLYTLFQSFQCKTQGRIACALEFFSSNI